MREIAKNMFLTGSEREDAIYFFLVTEKVFELRFDEKELRRWRFLVIKEQTKKVWDNQLHN